MSLVLEKPFANTQLEQLGIEFFESVLDGTLTEKRYDEIIGIAAVSHPVADALYSMVMHGAPAWREKHIRRFNIVNL